ncbi:hypothetical protein AM587_10002653 [Phytophthora nicotianae]|uniref:Uncharacterized protein n=1 Tax=Phytophthora nicotianae TaxID=4792 RepID=A0A0W8BXK3_PHYNI|nr:hypothetical protein AM587_10002653 [Phytophthora nicotianae]
MTSPGDKTMYPQLPRAQEVPMNIQAEMPYKCGNCGTTHVVRNATHGSTFQCTACGAQNQILLQHRRPVVVVGRSYSFLPIPIICNIM